MKDPVEILKKEHEVIEKGLDVLEHFTNLNLSRNQNSEINILLEFFSQFADKCHHAKEEESLFPLAEKKGIVREGGSIGVMLLEHDEGRKLRKSIVEESKNLNKNFEKFCENAKNFVGLLRQHIEKENNILYPMIDSVLDKNDKEKLFEKFERIEEKMKGVHAKYFKLIKSLGKKMV